MIEKPPHGGIRIDEPTARLWPDPEIGPWCLEFRWHAPPGGALECVDFRIRSAERWTAEPDLAPNGDPLAGRETMQPVTASMLRTIPIASVIDEEKEKVWETHMRPMLATFTDPQSSNVRPAFGRRRSRPRGDDPERLAAVANVYRAEASKGTSGTPMKAVADHFNISHATAARWINRAREVGRLEARS
jgi:hypothetical protein